MKARCLTCSTTWRFPDSTPVEKLVCPDCGGRISEQSTTASTHHGDVRREVPAEIAGYRIVSRIARGATGSVYRATDPGGRTVALKVLRGGGKPDSEEVARFQREAQATMRLDHPNIVRVQDAGFAGTRHFIAMEFIEGTSLRDLVASGSLTARAAAAYIRDIARALEHAHSRGVIHRDLKPENILVTSDGVPKLSDFGIAKLDGASTRRLTMAGIALGTPEYMSPEQAEGRSHDADLRTDIWSLGVILYECAARRLPFQGKSAALTLDAIIKKAPPALKPVAKEADGRLEGVILKCMSKAPEGRYSSASALALDLDRWLKGEEVSAPPRSTLARFFKRVLGRRRK